MGFGNSSASHATAATNSTQTPMKVVQRRTSSIIAEVLKPDRSAETAKRRMLQVSTARRPKRSVSQPPSRPKTPPHTALDQVMYELQLTISCVPASV